MKNKGFTLIELLVVVAIIGILAAVGVVAYNGYTSGAKKSASIANFKNVVKYISNEVMKCTMGESKAMNNNLDCTKQGANCLLYTSPSPRDMRRSRMPSSA